MGFSKKISRVFYLILILSILYLLYFHVRFALTRYFDADEFAHLHWGYSFMVGEKPYADFFYLFPPFFLFPIAAIMKVFGRTFESILVARGFILVCYLGVLGTLGLIARKMRGNLSALLAVFFVLFIPMPQDKMIEIRPDLLSLFFALTGIYFFIKAQEKVSSIKYQVLSNLYLISGLFYGLSLVVVPKIALLLIPVGIILLFDFIRNQKNTSPILSFITGLFIPAGFVLIFAAWTGKFQLALYSMSQMASHLTKILGYKFYIPPAQFFNPVDIFYGLPGYSPALYVTIAIFILGFALGVLRLMSFFSHQSRTRIVGEFMLSSSLLITVLSYIYLYPLKHTQYWIPAVPFLAFFMSDLVLGIPVLIKRFQSAVKIYPVLIIGLVGYLTYIGVLVYQKKMPWTNLESKAKLEQFLKTIPEDEPVFDLTGESVFFRNGYYFCCIPYGQYEEGLGFPVPDLEKDMKDRVNNYIYEGYEGRIGVTARGQEAYIRKNFSLVPGVPYLWKRIK